MTRHLPSQPAASASLTIRWLPGRYAVCRLGPHEVIPPWAVNSRGFMSVTRTTDELSIVAEEAAVPPHVRDVQRGWSLLRVVGRLDFHLVGILSQLTGALAAAHVPVFAVSSYDTDYLLVPSVHLEQATAALSGIATVDPDTSKRPNA